ncbi:hypothetical protein, partial [Streptococcus azizii]
MGRIWGKKHKNPYNTRVFTIFISPLQEYLDKNTEKIGEKHPKYDYYSIIFSYSCTTFSKFLGR